MKSAKGLGFSISTLLLLAVIVAIGAAYFVLSREFADTKQKLAQAKKDGLILDVKNSDNFNVIALPTYSDLQWRWKIQLPNKGKYRVRVAIDDIPMSEFPADAIVLDNVFVDSKGEKVAEGSFVFQFTVSKSSDQWSLMASVDGRGIGHPIGETPAWLEPFSPNGWPTFINGRNETVSAKPAKPLELLRMRRLESLGGNSYGIAMEPTDGLLVWIESCD